MRSLAWSFASALVCGALGTYACSAPEAPAPVASFATTREAGIELASIRDAWQDPAHVSRADLRAMLERFVVRYANDGATPMARALLALLYLDTGDYARADEQLRLLVRVPAGTTADLATVARARALRLKGQSAIAMTLLRPNVGKNVDPIVKNVFQEELALTALATGADNDKYEAIAYMDAWLQAAGEEEREATRAKVVAIIAKLPREVLEASLKVMRARGTSGYGKEMFKIVYDRLSEIALAENDPELARLLLDPASGSVPTSSDAGVALADLATSRRGINVVQGRTIGLVLPTENPALRDESADVLRGVMWALGKPRGIRELLPTSIDALDGTSKLRPSPRAIDAPGKKTPPPPKDASALPQCARAAEADDATLTTDEPKDDDKIALITRDDSGSADQTETSLDELVGQGASVIIAALDASTATRVLAWSAKRSTPVIVLAAPTTATSTEKTKPAAPSGYGFVLGEQTDEVTAALAREVPELTKGKVAPVVDASDLGDFPASGGAWGPFTLLPPASCDAMTPHAGDPRFPIAAWEKAGVRAWLVTGSPACARDVVVELSARTRGGGVVALTLDAASEPMAGRDLKVMSAAAGILPLVQASLLRDSELRRFVAAFGPPRLNWYTALGRDAATLARRVVMTLPTDTATNLDAVTQRRDFARQALAKTRVRMWSTEARGFDGKNAITRTICVLDVARTRTL